ncbi:BtrH N-terminal domain-containing protein [Streptomyces sp. NPDC093591]|uniref:BtrH N-terminal domain-containing protein n=1 Tax=Streptomyces sp. NPDC093591 TaxID=3366044 RepID=UPI00380D125C
MTLTGTPVRTGEPVSLWYRDPISCLQATLGSVVLNAGGDPLEVLGAHWEFRFRPGDVRPEEFYFPCAFDGDPARSIAPYHGLRSRWHTAADRDRPLASLAAELAEGRLVLAGVDNYHLPFRPAYHDVHAAHLLVVYGVDEHAGTVWVSDAMPPAFQGPIAAEDFLRAWTSANPDDEQDAFFSDAPLATRYLTVTVDTPLPELDAAALARVLGNNVAGFTGVPPVGGAHPVTDESADWTGLAGLFRWLERTAEAAARGDGPALRETYPLGWAMQAQACLHGEFLRAWGQRHGVPALREAGRRVEQVAHAWTGVRMTAAHGHGTPRTALPALLRHGRRLERAYATAVEALDDARKVL